MELEDDECFCCGEGKVILNTGLKLHKLYKSLFLEPILDVQEQDKLLSSLKICPLCYHKLILAVTTNKLIKSAQSKDYKRGKCMMCSKGDFMLKVVEWDHFKEISNDFPFADNRDSSSSNICSDCLFYLDTRHVVKVRILSKFPQLKKNPQLEEKMKQENKSDLKKMNTKEKPEVKTKAKLKLMLDMNENPKAKPNSEQKKLKKSGSESKVTNYSTRASRNSAANSSAITISSDNESGQEVSANLSCLKKFKTLKQNRILRLSKTASADPKFFMMIPYIMLSSNLSVSSPVEENISKTRTLLESANEDSEGGNAKKQPFFKIKLKSTRKRVSLIKKRDDSKILKKSLSLTTRNKLGGLKKSLIVDVVRMKSEAKKYLESGLQTAKNKSFEDMDVDVPSNNMVSLSSAGSENDSSEAGMDGILNETEKSETKLVDFKMDHPERNGHSEKQKKYKPRPLSKLKETNPDLEENNKSKNSTESPDLINDIKKNRFKRSHEPSPDLENEHKKSRIEQTNSEIEDAENINDENEKEESVNNVSGDSVRNNESLHHENSDNSKNYGQKGDSSQSPPESNKKKKYRPKPLSKLKKEIPQEEVKVNDENVSNGNTENDKRTSRNEETNSDSEQEKDEHGLQDENMKSKDDEEGKDESVSIPGENTMDTDKEKTVKNSTTVNEDTKDGGSNDEEIKEDENSTADEDTKDEGSDNEGTDDKNRSVADEDNHKVSDDEERNNENMNLEDEDGTIDKVSDDDTIEYEDKSDDPKDRVSADERISENSIADDEERKEDIDSDSKQIHDNINSTADDHESSDVAEAKEDENISAAGDDGGDKEKGSDDGEIKDEHSTVADEDNTGSDVEEAKDECGNSTDEGINARDSENEKKDETSVSDEDVGDKDDENNSEPDVSNDFEESHNLKNCSDDTIIDRVKMRARRQSVFIGDENDTDRDNKSGSTGTQEENENSEDENNSSQSAARESNKVTDSNKENNIIESCNQERSDSETENDKVQVTKNSLDTNNTDNSDNEIDKNNGDSENESINTKSKNTDVNAKEKKKKKVTFCENV